VNYKEDDDDIGFYESYRIRRKNRIIKQVRRKVKPKPQKEYREDEIVS